MTFGLIHASYSLPDWQDVKLTFFASCACCTVQIEVDVFGKLKWFDFLCRTSFRLKYLLHT